MAAPPEDTAAPPPDPPARDPVLASFRQIVPLNAGVTFTVSSVVALMLLPSVPPLWVGLWWFAHVAPAAYMMTRWTAAPRQRSEAELHRLRRIDVAWSTFSGLTWGAGALFFPYLDPQRQMMLVVVAAGMIAGSSATLAVIPRSAVAYILSAALPYILQLLLQGQTITTVLAGLSFVYMGAMLMTTRIVYGVIARNKRLRRENEALLRHIETAKASLLDIAESAEAFALLDRAGNLQVWNRKFADLVAPHAPLQAGEPAAPRLVAAGLPPALAVPRDTDERDTALGIVSVNRKGDDSSRHMRLVRRRTPAGDVALVLIDVTEQQAVQTRLAEQNRRLERAVQEAARARDEAEAANRAKSAFLANMSHELRTPLNAVIGFTDIVRRKLFGPDSPKYDEYLGDVHSSATHLLGIINDVLDLARIEANRPELNESDVDLEEEIATCLRLAGAGPAAEGKRLEHQVPADLPPLHADRRLLRQVLLNLIGNALKFSGPGSTVRVTAGLAHDGGIVIRVADQGIGIAEDDRERIFAPFEQGGGAERSRQFGGIGLGLAVVRAYVNAHQGTVSIDSAPQRGTCVSVFFPPERTIDPAAVR